MCFERRKHNGAYTHSAAWNTHKCIDVSGNRSFFQIHTGPKMEGDGDCLFHADGGALRISLRQRPWSKTVSKKPGCLGRPQRNRCLLLHEEGAGGPPHPSLRRCRDHPLTVDQIPVVYQGRDHYDALVP